MENLIKIPRDTECKIVKWKVKAGSRISKNTVIALYQAVNSEKQEKLKSNCVGIVKAILVTEGQTVQAGGNVLAYEGCQHPIVMKDMCAECGADLREKDGLPGSRKQDTCASVAMVHSVPELIVSEEQAKSLGHEDEERLLKGRKLVLLVDLDQTLIHTTNDNVPVNLKDVFHFQLWHGRQLLWYHTRFRPGTEKFLAAISQMYELHICTFGARLYAHTIAGFLDPKQQLFSHRILSRDECFNISSKTANLKALFPCGDSMVCIIDDREDVWNFIPSLVHVKPYNFFEGTADINAPPGWEKGKNKEEGGYGKRERKSKIVKVLKKTKEEGKTPEKNKKDMGKEKGKEEEDGKKSEDPKNSEDKTPEEAKTDKDKEKDEEKASNVIKQNNDNVDNETAAKETTQDNGDKEKEDDPNEKGDAESKRDMSMEVDDSGTEKTKDSGDNYENDLDMSDDDDDEDGKEDGSDTDTKAEDTKIKEQKTEDSDDKKDDKESKEEKDEVKSDSKDGFGDKPKRKASNGSTSDSEKDEKEYEEMVEWEDDDDYLIYLEDILTRIHKAFFHMYDEAKDKKGKEPDLKLIIPYIRKKILKGTNVLFSGVVPTNMPMEKSRAYNVAKSLGANIHTVFISKEQAEEAGGHTTHVIAAKPGTQKVNQAAKHKDVFLVKPEWLWNCNDRWERVDERLFLLKVDLSKISERGTDSPKPMKKRAEKEPKEPVPSTSATSAQIGHRRFSETINPMAVFSTEDIADMDKEVDDLISGSDDEEDDLKKREDDIAEEDEEEEDNDADGEDTCDRDLRSRVLGHTPPESSSDESLDDGTPRGWKNKRKRKREVSFDENTEDVPADNLDDEDPDEAKTKLYIEARESPRSIFKRGSESSSTSDDQESVGSIDDEMVAAIEKEFLK